MMTWKAFAKTVFEIQDADPMYGALYRAELHRNAKYRFMVAWCAFYNPGIAAKASEIKDVDYFWQYLHDVYPIAKRASERRHFRGVAGTNAINSWRKMFVTPEVMAKSIFDGDTYFDIARNLKPVALMGDYFSWKWADVKDRVFAQPCEFPPESAAKSPKVPQQGALLIAPEATVLQTYTRIADYMNSHNMLAPPRFDRPMGLQEAETVCCVFKQMSKSKWAPYTRTAKATRSLMATRSLNGNEILRALHEPTEVKPREYESWSNEKLAQIGL